MRLQGRDASRVGMLSPPDTRTEMLRQASFNCRQELAGPFWGKNKMETWWVSTRTQTGRVEIETRFTQM